MSSPDKIKIITFANIMDLTKHIPVDQAWIQEYASLIGWYALTAYYDKVYLMLLSLPIGAEFKILDKVDPEHYDLFIKCVVAAMSDVAKATYCDKSYYIEQQATVILVR